MGLVLSLSGISMDAASAAPQQPSHNQSNSIIGNNAFAHSQGVITINQVAGSGNAQINSINMVIGATKPVPNSILAQSVTALPKQASTTDSSSDFNTVGITATAFKGAAGIVQINQVSGSGNTSANSFALGIAPGVLH